MFSKPSLFKRLMLSVLALSFALWCVVVFFMMHDLKKLPEKSASMNLEASAKQQLLAVRAMQSDLAIIRYVNEADEVQANLHKKLSIFVSRYYVQVWRGDRILVTFKHLPTVLPNKNDLSHLSYIKPLDQEQAWSAWCERDSETNITLRVVQEPAFGFSLSYRLIGFYLVPFLISVPFLFIPIWLAISRGLSPLNKVATEVVERTDINLSNISPSPYRELSPIVDAINRLMAKINLRIQREQEFLHDAAHELKTPLAVIQLNCELLESSKDTTTQKAALEGIKKGVARATRTTHQLLAAARTENNHTRSDARLHLNFSQLLQERLAFWSFIALQKNIEIELNAPNSCDLLLNRESITLLVDNLVDNAIKYSDPGSTVKVNLEVLSHVVQLQVIDQGVGIAEIYREKVFERFFRINQSDGHGTGLGLSIVKRAADEHSANIELKDNCEVGHGLNFTVMFPLNEK